MAGWDDTRFVPIGTSLRPEVATNNRHFLQAFGLVIK